MMWVCLLSKTHPQLMEHMYCHEYQYPGLFPVLFLQSLYILYGLKNFSFTCIYIYVYTVFALNVRKFSVLIQGLVLSVHKNAYTRTCVCAVDSFLSNV